MFLPLCYVAFNWGIPAYYSMVILTALLTIVQVTRVLLVRKVINITFSEYCREVVRPIVLTISAATAVSFFATRWGTDSLISLFLCTVVVAIVVLATVLTIGIKQSERMFLYSFVKNKICSQKSST